MRPAARAGSEHTMPLLQREPSFPVQASGYSASSIPGTCPQEVVPLQHIGPHPYMDGYRAPNSAIVRSPSWPAMPHRAGPLIGSFGDAQSRNGGQPKISHGSLPLFVKVLNLMSVLVVVANAPTAIFYSYFLSMQTPLLIAAPLASFFGIMAVFLPKWAHKSRLIKKPLKMVKTMKFLAMVALTFDFIGGIVVPLVMYSVVCPHVGLDNCPHDIPLGRVTASLAALFMVVHGALCIMLRAYAKSVVTNWVGEEGMRVAVEMAEEEEKEGIVGQHVASFPNGGNWSQPLGYGGMPCYRAVPGVPVCPDVYQPWRG